MLEFSDVTVAHAIQLCMVIAIPFLSGFARFDASLPLALLFIAAMLTSFLGLPWFLREIYFSNSKSAYRVSLNYGAGCARAK